MMMLECVDSEKLLQWDDAMMRWRDDDNAMARRSAVISWYDGDNVMLRRRDPKLGPR